jgi:hypothetical protein
MSTGTVSSLSYDNWQLIATNATTSGSSISFSCAGFKKLMLAWTRVDSSNNHVYMIINGTSAGYTGGAWINEYNGQFAQTSSAQYLSGIASNTHDGYVIIEDTLAPVPKRITGFGSDNGYTTSIGSSWNNTAAVTALTFNGGTFTAGSVSLYGIAG